MSVICRVKWNQLTQVCVWHCMLEMWDMIPFIGYKTLAAYLDNRSIIYKQYLAIFIEMLDAIALYDSRDNET